MFFWEGNTCFDEQQTQKVRERATNLNAVLVTLQTWIIVLLI